MHSFLTHHGYLKKHNINCVNVKIMDEGNKYFSRLMSEMLQIRSNNNAINVKNDTQNLKRIYDYIAVTKLCSIFINYIYSL